MKNNGSNTFTIKNNKGEEIECDLLFTFDSDEFNKSYIVFTDNSLDENGNVKVYANTYDKDGNSNELKKIETEEEWTAIEDILASLQEKTGMNND